MVSVTMVLALVLNVWVWLGAMRELHNEWSTHPLLPQQQHSMVLGHNVEIWDIHLQIL